jgi:hypothetical protein
MSIWNLPAWPLAGTVLRQSRLVISPPVSLGNDTIMATLANLRFLTLLFRDNN